MNIWFNAIARAGGIEVAPGSGWSPAGPSTAHGNRPTLARRVLADIGGGVSLQALESRVSRLGRALNTWRRRRAAVRELSVLSDHMLQDIGLHRSEIRSVVEELLGSEPCIRGGSITRGLRLERLDLRSLWDGVRSL